jgi:hypothetical protein
MAVAHHPCCNGAGEAERHGRRFGKARTRSIGNHLLNYKLLRDLGNVGNPLYSLLAENQVMSSWRRRHNSAGLQRRQELLLAVL